MQSCQVLVFLLCCVFNMDRGQSVRVDEIEIVYGSKGVVAYNNIDKNLNKSITLLNADGTMFATISLANHFIKFSSNKINISEMEPLKALLYKKYRFSPQEFYPDYGVIIFAYKSIRDRKAEVYIDKEKTTTKFIKIDPILFSVESWRKHLMGAIVEIENTKNSLKESPGDLLSAKTINVPDDASFRIIRFAGQWVQVECFSFCESVCEKKYKGWIRWTTGKQPLLVLYYAC